MFHKTPSRLTVFVLRTFAAFGLTELTTHATNGTILESSNLTILNFFLVRFGPMNEKKLVKILIWSQVSASDKHRETGLWILPPQDRGKCLGLCD